MRRIKKRYICLLISGSVAYGFGYIILVLYVIQSLVIQYKCIENKKCETIKIPCEVVNCTPKSIVNCDHIDINESKENCEVIKCWAVVCAILLTLVNLVALVFICVECYKSRRNPRPDPEAANYRDPFIDSSSTNGPPTYEEAMKNRQNLEVY